MSASVMGHNLYKQLIQLGLSTDSSFEIFHKGVRDNEDINVYRCKNSGVILLDRIDQGGSERYSEMTEFSYWKTLGDKKQAIVVNEDDIRRSTNLAPIIQGKSYLDFGSGAGGCVRLATQKAAIAHALEIQPAPREFLNKEGIKCFGDLKEIPSESYDVVSMFHVMEHLTDPVETLSQLKSKIKKSGKLIVEVPHANDFLISFLDNDAFKKFTLWSEHLILHTRKSLELFLREAGYKVISIEGFQRYSLANHLHWTSQNKQGGHIKWSFLDDAELMNAYSKRLATGYDRHNNSLLRSEMKISYISLMGLPADGASMVNILKMCNGFVENEVDLSLSMPVVNSKSAKNEVNGFNVSLPVIHFFPKAFGKLIFILASLFRAKKEKRIIYTRNVEVSFLAGLMGLHNIIELHSPHRERHVLIQWMLTKVFKSERTELVVSISSALKEILVKSYSVNPLHIKVLHDGSDLEIDSMLTNPEVKNIGYVGHLYQGRGIEIIFHLAHLFPQYKFHLVGGRIEEIESWKPNVKSTNVIFHGHKSHAEASLIRHQMDILLAPYQSSTKTRAGLDSTQWMSPLKIFEYMASGKPFICSDLPVLREILEDKRNALLVNASDLEAWKNALKSLVEDSLLRNTLAQNAWNDIKSKYSWSRRAQEIIESLTRGVVRVK